jgi:hypothetical protein
MASSRSNNSLTENLGTPYRLGAAGPLSDNRFLERFLARGDPEEAEEAFAALVERHGPVEIPKANASAGVVADPTDPDTHATTNRRTYPIEDSTPGSRDRDSPNIGRRVAPVKEPDGWSV